MKKKNNNLKIFNGIFILLLTIFGTFLYYNKPSTSNIENGNLQVYFIDVGQADAIMIKENDKYALIDAGNNNDGNLLVDYFKKSGITDFEYVFGTHPHEDHIGGMDDIIDNFNIDNFYMPNAITTTKTFEDVLDALDEKNVELNTPTIGEKFNLGNAIFEVMYVGEDDNDLNNTSIVLKLTYGNNKYLFMGDATDSVEKDIINDDIEADVIKIGHHGSKYSSTAEFIKKVNPEYAIISVGQNNSYDHPSTSTIDLLESNNIQIYRTDVDGTIISSSDGNTITFRTEQTNTDG